MSNDSSTPPGTETRLLILTEKLATATERIVGYFRQTKELLDGLSQGHREINQCQRDLTDHVTGLAELCRSLSLQISDLKSQLSDLKSQCKDAQKKSGPLGVFEWAMRAAREQPMAFSLVFITTVMSLILLTLLGYSLNLRTLLGG